MAITFPREIPDVGYVRADMILRDPVKASPSGARLINYTQINDPAWEVAVTTKPLRYDQYAEVEAWWLSLREGLQRVLFRLPFARYPKNHINNHAPADDAGNLVSVTGGNVLSVSGVDAGLSLAIGDRIGLERLTRYHIGRVTEVAGAGTTRTITIEPPPFATVSQAGTVVRFANPALIMRPVPGSFEPPRDGLFYNVSFRLVEAQ
ncbi:hypothetical protein [Neorhizobium sp. T6_25]|uniref:hypothetical protein n=1 Tax=Neorhizobium sp. T6_25 TaxID=2093833 RepID=UPI000CF85F4F|nr:hypothetical protein [Neorhizobium sp. T6_25]